MLAWLHTTREYVKRWVLYFAHHKYAELFLGAFSFFESLIIPVPTDIFLAPMVLARPRAWIRLSGITTITSVLGGIAAYGIGLWAYETIGVWMIGEYGIEENFVAIQELFDKNTFWAIVISGITVIPYNVVALAGGLFVVDFWAFLFGSIVGRGIRYFVESYFMSHFGRSIARRIYKIWNWFIIISGILVIIGIILYFILH